MADNTIYDRHPPQCAKTCQSKHHPILVTLLNCSDEDPEGVQRIKLQALDMVVKRYESELQNFSIWHRNQPIPDVCAEYQCPILHWACTIGLVSVLKWMKENGYSMMTLMQPGSLTGFHRAITHLPLYCKESNVEKFKQMLNLMESSLLMGNNVGNSPLHLCCHLLESGTNNPKFYVRCIFAVLFYVKENFKTLDGSLFLSNRNSFGDTPLHLLARSNRCVGIIKLLIRSGASLTVRNKQGWTPYAVAVNYNQKWVQSLLWPPASKTKFEEKHDYLLDLTNSQSEALEDGSDVLEQEINAIVVAYLDDYDSMESPAGETLSNENSVDVPESKLTVQTEHLDFLMDSDVTESDESDNENSDTDISKVILPDALVEELREKSINCNMSAEHNNMVFLALLEAQKYKLLLEDSMNNLTELSHAVQLAPLDTEQIAPILADQKFAKAMKTDEGNMKSRVKELKQECLQQESGLRGLTERLNHVNDALGVLRRIKQGNKNKTLPKRL